MTIKEHKELLGKISDSVIFIMGIEHAMQKTKDAEGAIEQLRYSGWSSETKATILLALEAYKKAANKQIETREDI